MLHDNTNDELCITELLQSAIGQRDLTNIQIRIQPGSEAGDGYVSTNTAVDIYSNGNELKLFIKSAPAIETCREKFLKQAFSNEIHFYEKIYPEFLKFQSDRNVKNPFEHVPKCYATRTEYLKEALVLDNLKGHGYELFDKTKMMNSDHIAMVFRCYARFHAVSFAMQDQNLGLFKELVENISDAIAECVDSSGFGQSCRRYCEDVMKFFDPNLDSHIINKIENMPDKLMDMLINVRKYKDVYSVITQGDCWCNNIMFKYENSTDQSCPCDVRLVDWQMVRENSPMLDVSYFFYSVSSKENMTNLENYQNIYYDTLAEHIRGLGSDPDKLYPRSVMKDHWKTFSKYGLLMSFIVIKMMLTDKDEAPTLSNTKEKGKDVSEMFIYKIRKEDVYRQRVKDVIEHFVANNFL